MPGDVVELASEIVFFGAGVPPLAAKLVVLPSGSIHEKPRPSDLRSDAAGGRIGAFVQVHIRIPGT
jgi:hypothetical protein